MIDLTSTSRSHARIEEFAEYYGVSRRTVYYWAEKGKIPVVRVGGSLRIPLSFIKSLEHRRAQFVQSVQSLV
jgi:excisionase family DNA binding protein